MTDVAGLAKRLLVIAPTDGTVVVVDHAAKTIREAATALTRQAALIEEAKVAVQKLTAEADGFNVSGVYFNEGKEARQALDLGYAFLAKLEE